MTRPKGVTHDIIVLAGGGGTRLGGVDKARLEVGGRRLQDRVLDGAGAARQVVVAGVTEVPEGVLRTVEDPPGGGPVAGIIAALATLTATRSGAPWTLVLAVDQPTAGEAVPLLLAAAADAAQDIDLLCPHDVQGHPQWLLGAYRTASLVAALAPLGTGHHTSVRRLVRDLRISDVPVPLVGDIDTWEDHARWQDRLAEPDAGV